MSDTDTGPLPTLPRNRPLSFLKSNATLLTLVALANIVVFSLLGFNSYTNYQQVKAAAKNKTQSLNTLLVGNVTGEFDRIKFGLEISATQISRLRSQKSTDRLAETDVLSFSRQRLPMLENMAVTDANGKILHSTDYPTQGISIADRKYFIALHDNPQQGLLISDPISGRLSGKPALVIALPISRKDGGFDGIVLASITIEWFIQKFATVDGGKDTAVVLRGDASRNFDLLARYKPTGNIGETAVSDRFKAMIAANPARGTYEAVAGNDKIHRMFSYKSLENYPLITLVGLSTEVYMAEWYSQASKMLALALAFALTTSLGGWLIFRAWRSRMAAEQEIKTRIQIEKIQEDNLRQLEAARDIAEKANQSKSRFLAAASHDLRQPMQAINLFTYSLSKTDLSVEQKIISRHLTDSTQALADLLNVLLDISKLDAGVIELTPETIPVDVLASKIETGFSALVARKSLRFKLSFPFGNMAVKTDAQLVMRLLGNLIDNAIKYTERGGILVAIRRRGDHALIQVWDTGIGISAKNMGIIFDEYVQIGNPERDRTKGLGLGLAIAKRIAKLLGTDLTCRSRLGKGSIFEFLLPLTLPADTSKPNRINTSEASDRANFAGRRIAFIEDDLMVGAATKQALESYHMSVTHYESAEKALADPAITQFNFYISDLRLPGMNGFELLDNIQQRSSKPIKALVLTGDTSAERIEEMHISGWPVLFKPVDLSKLISAIKSQDAGPA